ncbi:MAG: hypothetical protein AB7H97_00415 [Pseudobdellovibrionaceae bacterium]
MHLKIRIYFLLLVSAVLTLTNRAGAHEHDGMSELQTYACTKASIAQIARVNLGNSKYNDFLKACHAQTNNSPWCRQLTRPNPDSQSTFSCTYGPDQTHRLIDPDTSTWKNAFKAVRLVKKLESYGISVAQIYNWWRPEPYNKNVGGASGRHPYGTSIDVRFSTITDMNRAHKLLCKWRSQGSLRALGYYGSTGLHFGIGDRLANTWGKSCSIY